jgi:hypothetical protein
MPNINEKTITAKTWLRSPQQIINSGYNILPSCDIIMEEAIDLNGQVARTPKGTKSVKFDATKTFPKTDPATGEVVGEWSQAELQHIWYDFVTSNLA